MSQPQSDVTSEWLNRSDKMRAASKEAGTGKTIRKCDVVKKLNTVFGLLHILDSQEIYRDR